MFLKIESLCRKLESERDLISEERKLILKSIVRALDIELKDKGKADLIYICTHNSRRSHFGQIWASVASELYGVSSLINAFSGGSEVTALHPHSIKALESLGFELLSKSKGENLQYEIKFGDKSSTFCYSKLYDDKRNPQKNFIAIMTCSQADENCPSIPGATFRSSTPYGDPKIYDNTKLEKEKYLERALEIGREVCFMMFFLTSKKDNA